MWTYWIHDLRTGDPELQVYPAACSWTRRLSGRGDGRFTFSTADGTSVPRFGAGHELLRPYNRVIAVRWGDHVAYAGVIREWEYDAASRTVQASTEEVRVMFSRRLMGRPTEYGPAWDFSYTGRSANGAVNAILERSLTLTTEYRIPIDKPPWTEGSLSRQARFYEIVTAEDLLREVEDTGATIDFAPYVTDAGRLRWKASAWTTYQRGVLDLSVSAPDSPIRNLRVRLNGDRQASGVVAVGKGTGADMLVAYATQGEAGMPALVQRVDVKDFDRIEEVAAAGRAAVLGRVWPIEQWSYDVHVGSGLSPADLEPGMLLRLDLRGDTWIPDGLREQRVLALAGDMTDFVRPEVQ